MLEHAHSDGAVDVDLSFREGLPHHRNWPLKVVKTATRELARLWATHQLTVRPKIVLSHAERALFLAEWLFVVAGGGEHGLLPLLRRTLLHVAVEGGLGIRIDGEIFARTRRCERRVLLRGLTLWVPDSHLLSTEGAAAVQALSAYVLRLVTLFIAERQPIGRGGHEKLAAPGGPIV